MSGRVLPGNCLDLLPDFKSKSVDMILTDLPYGTTRLPSDKRIPFEPMWEQFQRIITPRGAIVLTAAQPFTSLLIASNLEMYRYSWVWRKTAPTGFLNANKRPLRVCEDVCVFSHATCGAGSKPGQSMHYWPQGLVAVNKVQRNRHRGRHIHETNNVGARNVLNSDKQYTTKFKGYPVDVLEFDNDKPQVHPLQKPVALLEYLIRTYTERGMVVLDATAGYGSTAIAAINAERNYALMELSPLWCEKIDRRVAQHLGSRVRTLGVEFSGPPKESVLDSLHGEENDSA